MTDEPTAVYRLYDEAGDLLYVGISKHPEQRFVEHSQIKFWWHLVVRKQVDWYPTRKDAEDEETRATISENPRHDRTWRMSNSPARKHGIRRQLEQDPERGRIVDEIRQAIRRGQYQIGSRLPGYRGIAELFGVSITTAKFAVSDLVRDGLVCNLSRSAGYPVTVVRQEPTGKPASREEFLHLAHGGKNHLRGAANEPPARHNG